MKRARRISGDKQGGRTPKERRTFTLSRESIALLQDLRALRRGSRRRSVSAVLDDLLRALVKQRKREIVEQAITRFYDALPGPAQSEESAWGEFSLAQFTNAPTK